MTKRLRFIERCLFFLTVFLLPTQLGLHFWPSFAFVYGIRVDYLSPTIYLTDILIALLLGLLCINAKKNFLKFIHKKRWYFYCFFAFVFLNILFSSLRIVSFLKWLKILEVVLFAVYVYLRQEFLRDKAFLKTLFYSGFFFAIIGVSQVLLSRTTGLFYLMGERNFVLSTPGIALYNFAGKQILRAYSTFSHPNSFAGFLGILIILVFWRKSFVKKGLFYFGLLVISLAFFLTFSLSAALSLMAVSLMAIFFENGVKIKKIAFTFLLLAIVASLVIPVAARQINLKAVGDNISQRMDLAYISGRIFSEKFLTGIGANNFVVNSVKFAGLNKYTWILQPVHNIFLLALSEYGILGLFCLFALFYKMTRSFRKEAILATMFVVFVGVFDHYFLTLQQNLLYLGLLVGYSFTS